MRRLTTLVLAAAVTATATEAAAASLRGSPAAMVQQNTVAKEHGLAFYGTAEEIMAAVDAGTLVPLPGNADYSVADFVRFPYAQPEVRLFVERLSAQYRAACDQKLVVTSAVRPSSGQPSNAHALSVHPAGMAVDLRVSDRAECRDWLEGTLMSLERAGVLNGIREFHPPHYHVALFPQQYRAHVERQIEAEAARLAAAEVEIARELPVVATALRELAAEPALPAAAEAESAPASRSPLKAAIVLLLATPLGLGYLVRRARSRSRGN